MFEREWLVIFNRDGTLETAFPPNAIDSYVQIHGFEYLGTIGEVLP